MPAVAKKRERAKRRPGRPLALTPAVERALLKAFEQGLTQKDAAHCAGIHPATLSRYLEQGLADDGPPEFRALCEKIERARAKGRKELIEQIRKHAKKEWRAGAHLLAIADKAYSPRHQLEVSGDATAPVGVKVYLPQLDATPGANGQHGPAEPADDGDGDGDA